MIEEADIVGDWARPSLRRGVVDGRRLRRRAAGRRTARSGRPAGATPPSTRRTAAAASAPRSRTGCRTTPASAASRRSGCRCRWARPATGCSRRWATASAGRAGAGAARGRDHPRAAAARGVRRPRGRPVGVRRSAGRSRRTRSSSGRCASGDLRRLARRDDRPARLRAMEPARRGRPGGRPWSRRPGCSWAAGVGVHRPPRHHEGGARPRSGPGTAGRRVRRRPGSAARPGPSCRPTRAPVRSALYEKVGMVVTSTWVNRGTGPLRVRRP